MKRVLIPLLSIVYLCNAFVDEDFDGVDDTVDMCPDTPFDVLVDKNGCPLKEKEIDFFSRIGSGFTIDDNYKNRFISITLGVGFKEWYFSIYTNYFTYDSSIESSALGDTFAFLSYSLFFEDVIFSPGVSVKIPTASSQLIEDNTFEVSPSIYIDYTFNDKDIFVYYGYMFRGSTNYNNSYTLSIGGGYQMKKLYISSSFDRNGFGDNYLSIYSQYDFNKNYVFLLNYSYGLNSNATKHFAELKFGVNF